MAKYSFKKGWDMVPQSKGPEVRERIKTALGITSDPQFYNRLKGIPEPLISEYEDITAIFAEYGIKDCWGE